jgi:hypothetical protein
VKENREKGKSRSKKNSKESDSCGTSDSIAGVINKQFTRSNRILADSLKCHPGDHGFENDHREGKVIFFSGFC